MLQLMHWSFRTVAGVSWDGFRDAPSISPSASADTGTRATFHVPLPPPRLLRRFFTGVVVGSALLLTASPADGDVGVVGSVRPSALPASL